MLIRLVPSDRSWIDSRAVSPLLLYRGIERKVIVGLCPLIDHCGHRDVPTCFYFVVPSELVVDELPSHPKKGHVVDPFHFTAEIPANALCVAKQQY